MNITCLFYFLFCWWCCHWRKLCLFDVCLFCQIPPGHHLPWSPENSPHLVYFQILHIVNLLEWLSPVTSGRFQGQDWRLGGFRHLARQAGACSDYPGWHVPRQRTDWLLLAGPRGSQGLEPRVGMGRGCGVKHPIHRHLPLEGTICLLFENAHLGRIRKVETKGGERRGWTRCLQPGRCWLCAGQLCLHLLWAHAELGQQEATLKDSLQMRSAPPSRALLKCVLAAKAHDLGKNSDLEAQGQNALGGGQPEVLLPAIALP